MKIHTIGIDVSPFNCLIGRVKTAKYDVAKAKAEILEVEKRVTTFSKYLTGETSALPLFPDDRMDELKAGLLAECNSEYCEVF
ncbi:hypothetical protein, partial [Escherichia coli]|uniref:hypothetical protein n=1 Tax=Escherichia coli TaxID=562 RepID=UPI0012D12AF5